MMQYVKYAAVTIAAIVLIKKMAPTTSQSLGL